jgi:hypothetical protein
MTFHILHKWIYIPKFEAAIFMEEHYKRELLNIRYCKCGKVQIYEDSFDTTYWRTLSSEERNIFLHKHKGVL